MKYLATASAVLATAVTLSSGQSLSSLPTCGAEAALQAIQQAGCPITDVPCICSKISALDALRSNIIAECSQEDQALALKFQNELCGGNPGAEWQAEEESADSEEDGEAETGDRRVAETAIASGSKDVIATVAGLTDSAPATTAPSATGNVMTASAEGNSTVAESNNEDEEKEEEEETDKESEDKETTTTTSSSTAEFTGGAVSQDRAMVVATLAVMVAMAAVSY